MLVDSIEVRVGGAAGNAALALTRLGHRPRLIGVVGDDPLGRFVRESLQGMGLADDLLVLPGRGTGVSICVEAPERDRAFISVRGVLDRFDASMVPEDAVATSFLLLCGYFTLSTFRGRPALALLQRARRGGATIMLDPDVEAGGWSAGARREIRELLPVVDWFLPNEHEARGLTGVSNPVEAGRALQRRSGGWVVVKRGMEGVAAIGPDGGLLRVPVAPVDARDTTGAGDSFNAGLVHALSEGQQSRAALEFATRVASAVVSRPSDDRHPSLSDLKSTPP